MNFPKLYLLMITFTITTLLILEYPHIEERVQWLEFADVWLDNNETVVNATIIISKSVLKVNMLGEEILNANALRFNWELYRNLNASLAIQYAINRFTEVHINNGTYFLTGTIFINSPLFLDGDSSILTGSANPMIVVDMRMRVIFTNVTLMEP